MNYYPHHIGDFNSATRHLTRTERSIYRDLIELYYDTEAPLSADIEKLCRLVLARSDEERTAVEQVLNEFFTETEQGFAHSRCDAEIAKYHGNKEAKSAAGKASAAKRAQKPQQQLNACSTAVEQPNNKCATNQEPRTNNQEPDKPIPPKSPKRAKKEAAPDELVATDLEAMGVDARVAADYIALRHKKRTTVTKTVIEGVQREADGVGMDLETALRTQIERGWQGFKAGWLQNQARVSPARQTHSQRIADWNAELRDVLTEGQRPMEIDMGVIDATR